MTNKIGAAVRKERKAKKLTQQQLGDLAGTGLNFVSQVERGKTSARLDKIVSLLNILGLSLQVQRINPIAALLRNEE